MAGPLRRGGGVKGWAIKEKKTFFGTFFSNVPKVQQALSSRGGGGGGLGLNGPAIKRTPFFAASLMATLYFVPSPQIYGRVYPANYTIK